jgi:hypothetical protein
MNARRALRLFLRDVAIVGLIVGTIVAMSAVDADAGDVADPAPWPCIGEGWTPGDTFGVGPADVVPSAEPCRPIPVAVGETPEPSGLELAIDSSDVAAPAMTLPPTDTEETR